MKMLSQPMLAALGLLVVAACGDSEDTGADCLGIVSEAGLYELDCSHAPSPPTSGDTTLSLELRGAASGEAETGAGIVVVPWMPAHDHGITGEPEVLDLGEGLYEATWSYPMPGLWELSIEISGSAGEDLVVIEVDVE